MAFQWGTACSPHDCLFLGNTSINEYHSSRAIWRIQKIWLPFQIQALICAPRHLFTCYIGSLYIYIYIYNIYVLICSNPLSYDLSRIYTVVYLFGVVFQTCANILIGKEDMMEDNIHIFAFWDAVVLRPTIWHAKSLRVLRFGVQKVLLFSECLGIKRVLLRLKAGHQYTCWSYTFVCKIHTEIVQCFSKGFCSLHCLEFDPCCSKKDRKGSEKNERRMKAIATWSHGHT